MRSRAVVLKVSLRQSSVLHRPKEADKVDELAAVEGVRAWIRLLGLLVVVVAGGAAAVGCVNGDERSDESSRAANEVIADETQAVSEVTADETQAVESDHQVETNLPPDVVPLPSGRCVEISVGSGIHGGILASAEVACGGRCRQAGRRVPLGPCRSIEASGR